MEHLTHQRSILVSINGFQERLHSDWIYLVIIHRHSSHFEVEIRILHRGDDRENCRTRGWAFVVIVDDELDAISVLSEFET